MSAAGNRELSPALGRVVRAVALGLLGLGVVLTGLYGAVCTKDRILLEALERQQTLPLFVLGGGTLATAFLALAGARRRDDRLFLSVVVLQLALLPATALQLGAVREIGRTWGRWVDSSVHPARWGDESTFAPLYPVAPPFIGPGGRLLPRQNQTVWATGQPPRPFHLVTNSAGFRNDREVAPRPAPGTIRILSLGDSYSLGYGHDQERFFGAVLAKRLGSSPPVEVVNAEVSDPAFGLWYLQQYGVGLAPNVVILGFCGNDLMQANQFVGASRRFVLGEDGVLRANPRYPDPAAPERALWEEEASQVVPGSRVRGGPARETPIDAFELVRRLRRLATGTGSPYRTPPTWIAALEAGDGRKRLVDGFTNPGQYLRNPPPFILDWYRQGDSILDAWARTVRAAGARLVVVAWPHPLELHPGYWRFLVDTWGLDPAAFDTGRLREFLRRAAERDGFLLVDPTDRLTALSYDDLVLNAGDVHLSEKAAGRVAEAAAEAIGPMLAPR